MNLRNASWEILGKLVKYIKYEMKACLRSCEDAYKELFMGY